MRGTTGLRHGFRLAARDHLRRRRPGDHRRPRHRRGPRRDHRDRRGQGARRRGARRVPDAGRPGPEHPAAHRRAHRHHRRDGVRRARASTRCCRRSWSSPAARCWSPTTPASTSGSCARPPNAASIAWPRPPVLYTVRLARRVLTRDEAPDCGCPRWRDCSARPPHRPTGRSTTPAPPSTCCTR